MSKIEVLEQIRKDSNILSLPHVLSEVLRELSKDDYSADTLAKIILKDPSLTGRVLRMANSAFYQRYSEIKTVHQAIAVMGITTVKCLALSSSILHVDKVAEESGIDPKEFFAYILSVASASRRVAEAMSFPSTEEAFIAGLLHDVGLLLFLHRYPAEYRKVLSMNRKVSDLTEAEIRQFGVDHGEVGYQLAMAWRIPQEIAEAVRGHHCSPTTNEKGTTLQNIVRLGVLLTKDRFSGFEQSLEHRLSMIGRICGMLDLGKEVVDRISSSLLVDTFEIAEYLGVDIGNFEEMLTTANQEIWKTYLLVENLFKERQELSKNLLEEERAKGAMESKTIALSTLSHYLNNAVMAIYGRSQILRMMLIRGEVDKLLRQLPTDLYKIDYSVRKIVAVLEEMKEVSPIGEEEFHSISKTLNIDDKIEKRMAKMAKSIKWEEPPVPV